MTTPPPPSRSLSPREKTDLVLDAARRAGFALAGITTPLPPAHADYVRWWLSAGRHGSMTWLQRHRHIRLDPANLLDGARSVLVVADNYYQPDPPPAPASPPTGRIARYAWGEDYHRVVRDKLQRLVADLQTRLPEPFRWRICVDTAPIIERDLAARAGIGWIAKNTLILNERLGSFFVLGELFTTLELIPSTPATDHCGTCTRCLDACPTAAFPAPYEMDASRCISFLTIEHRADIPADLQPLIGDWLFGCDICQDVCPFNRRALPTAEPRYAVRPPAPRAPLAEILNWTPDDWRTRLRNSAMNRANLEMLKRNARIVQANARPDPSASAPPGAEATRPAPRPSPSDRR